MGEKRSNIILVIIGVFIFGLFTMIAIKNVSNSDEYFLSTDIVQDIDYNDGKLTITTKDNIKSVCIKQTKSDPSIDSLCWIDTINNKSTISLYEYKTYYIWLKDYDDIITFYSKYNLQDN